MRVAPVGIPVRPDESRETRCRQVGQGREIHLVIDPPLQGIDEVVLTLYVVVERGRLDAEPTRQPAHREACGALLVE